MWVSAVRRPTWQSKEKGPLPLRAMGMVSLLNTCLLKMGKERSSLLRRDRRSACIGPPHADSVTRDGKTGLRMSTVTRRPRIACPPEGPQGKLDRQPALTRQAGGQGAARRGEHNFYSMDNEMAGKCAFPLRRKPRRHK